MKKLFIIFILFCAQNISADSLSINGVEVGADAPTYPSSNCINSIGLRPTDLTLADAWQGSYLFSAESSEGEKPALKNDEYLGCCLGGCTFGKINPRIKRPGKSWFIGIPFGLIGCGAGFLIGKNWGASIGGAVVGYAIGFDIGSRMEKNNTETWPITEPIGGILGGFAGVVIGVPLMVIAGFAGNNQDAFLALGAFCVEYPILLTSGIWATGKYIEKEKGEFWYTFLGSALGEVLAIVISNRAASHKGPPTENEERISIGSMLALPLTGGLIAYRLSLKK